MSSAAVDGKAVDWALKRIGQRSPAAAGRAQVALNLLLEGLYYSAWPEVAWAFSQLNGDGFPVEFSFAATEEAIRYTTEVARPELAAADRLYEAEQQLTRLGTPPLPTEIRHLFSKIQMSGPLRYGTWAGGRHSVAEDRYKIYIETPHPGSDEADRFASTCLGKVPLLPHRKVQLRMIGYEPGSLRTEFYYRAPGLEPWEVGVLLRRVGLAAGETELFKLVEAASERSVQQTLPRLPLGFSFSTSSNGGPPVFSLFTTARSLWGGDGHIRRRLLELGRQRGWDWSHYALVSQPLADKTGWATYHGVLTFVIVPERPLTVYIGLRPLEGFK